MTEINYAAIPIFVIGCMFIVLGVVRPSPESNCCVKHMIGRMSVCWGENVYTGMIVYGIMMNIFAVIFLLNIIGKKE